MKKYVVCLWFITECVCHVAAQCNPCSWGSWQASTYPSFALNGTEPEYPTCVDKNATASCSPDPTAGTKVRYCSECGAEDYASWNFDSYTYTWVLTKPDGRTKSGSSNSASETPKEPGWYCVTFTATGHASDPTYDEVQTVNIWFEVFCCDCSSGTCVPIFGGTSASNSSVDVVMSLGMKMLEKRQIGVLHLHSEEPSSTLSTPQLLKYEGQTQDVQLIYSGGILRQVKTPQGLADIIVINSYKYEVRFYTEPGSFYDGLYHPTPGAEVSITTIENPDTSGASYNQLKVTYALGDQSYVSLYVWDATFGGWKLETGNGSNLKKDWLKKEWNAEHTIRTETRQIRNQNDQLAKKTRQRFQKFARVEKRIEETEDPDGAARTTSFSYDASGRLTQILRPDGSWEYIQYDAQGRRWKVYSTFLNQSLTTDPALCRFTEYSYQPVGGGDNGSVRPTHPRRIIEKLKGNEISRRYYVILAGEEREIRCQTPGALWDATDNLVTITKTYTSGTFADEVQSIKRPDGTMDICEYALNAAGTQRTNTVYSGQPNAQQTDIINGTKTVTVLGSAGEILSQTVSDIASGITIAQETHSNFDAFKRAQRVDYLDGTYELLTYGCCGLESLTDRYGIETAYGYDVLQRRYVTARNGVFIITSYDAADRVLSTTRQGTDGQQITLSQTQYDLAGRPTVRIDALGAITTLDYIVDGAGQTVTTTTFTNSATLIEIRAKDGALVKLTGTAVYPTRYEFGVESEGGVQRAYTKEIKLDANYNDTSEWIKTYADLLGRTYKTVYSDGAYRQSFYNNQGQLWKERDPDGVINLYQYNAKGELEYAATDLDQDSVIDFSGTDRITRIERDVLANHGYNVQRTQTYVWTTDNQDVSTVISIQETAVNALRSWSTSYGLTSQSQTTVNGNGSVTVTDTSADNTYTISQFQNSQVQSVTHYNSGGGQLGQTSYQYDNHKRQWKVTDARTGTTTYTYNNADQITSVTTPVPAQGQSAQTTTTYYDIMGRPWKIVLPDNSSVTNEYFLTGQLKKTSGSRTYPVEYTYDAQGRTKTLKTWQDFAGSSGLATTTWNYHNQRGWLASKRYNDNTGPDYTYKPSGRLWTRTWARGNPRLLTTYSYNNAGDLQSIDYADTTPDMSFTYDRRGHQQTATCNSITTTFTYNIASQLLNEAYSGGSLNGLSVTNHYDNYLRRDQLQAKNGESVLATATYGYNPQSGRLELVSDGTHSATYSYLANSPLVSQITFKQNGNVRLTTTKQYDNLNRLTSISSAPSGGATVSFAYQYNDANQRTRNTEASGDYWAYGYDALGQVSSGKKYTSGDSPISGRQFDYDFDDIGNRDYTVADGTTTDYTATLLNQYTVRVTGGSTENFVHDLDGNLTSDDLWTYTWNAENRLVKMESQAGVPAADRRKLQFAYDWQGRRIQKKVTNLDTGAVLLDNKFLYGGWNLVAELDAQNSVVRTCTWGLDLSGSEQGAGGVGGLLATTLSGQGTHFVSYDGNGNVMNLVSASSGTLTAQYEYSPFGEVLSATGTAATANPIRFSTKYADSESGFLYNGFRYYNPSTGRWLSRDPMGERGGRNLLCFVHNDPLNWVDKLGLSRFNCCNECSPKDEPRITGINSKMKWVWDGRSPNKDDLANDMLADVKLLSWLQPAGAVAGAATKTTASGALALMDGAFEKGRSWGWTGKITSAIEAIKKLAIQRDGAAIWIRIEWQKCEQKRCFPAFWRKYYDWNENSGWKRCSAEGSMASGGFDPSSPGEVFDALPGCIKEAINDLVK